MKTVDIWPQRRAFLLAGILGAAWALGQPGMAQADPGEGLRFGPLQVEPHLGINVQLDSNPLLFNDAERAANPDVPAALIALGSNPGLTASLAYDRLEVRASYDHFTRTYLTGGEYRGPLSYYDNFNGKAQVDLFPRGVFGATLRDSIRNQSSTDQQVDPDDIPLEGISDQLNDRLLNDMGLKFRYSPGPALDFYVGGTWRYEQYTGLDRSSLQTDGSVTEDLIFGEKRDLGLDASGRWKFFPRTYLLAEAEVTDIAYTEPSTRDLSTWVVRGGLVGQFTASIQAVGLLGYGRMNNVDDSYDDLRGPTGLVGQGTLNWSPEKTQTLSLSFVRNFSDNIVADYYVNNTVAFGYTGVVYDRLETDAGFGMDFRRLDYTPQQQNDELEDPNTRYDRRYRFRVSAAYRVAPWLRATAGYQLTQLDSNDDDLDYTRHLVTVGVRGSY